MAQRADFIIDCKPYMLARTGGDTGARTWQEQGPQAAETTSQLEDVAHGEVGQEVRIHWDTKHKGFGEPLRRISGRDYWGRNIDKRYPQQITLAREIHSVDVSAWEPGADPGGFAELSGDLYLAFGRYVLKIDSSNQVTQVWDGNDTSSGLTCTDIEAYKNILFLAVGEGEEFQYSGNGTTWVSHAALTATFFKTVQDRLYRISKGTTGSTPAYLSNNFVDPTDNLNWSALDPIGDPGVPVTGMATVAYQIFIAKEDGLYAADIETGRFPNLTDEIRPWRNPNNGRGSFGWGGLAFYPTVRGLKMYFSGQLFSAGPDVMSANDSEVSGLITAMAGDANWLFASLYNGQDTYILAGRNPRPDDRYPGEIVWNVVWYVEGGPFTAMTVSGLDNNPRLWIASQEALHYINLGNTLDNPLLDSTATYCATGTDYYPAHDAGSPMVDKHFLELRVYAENLSYENYITWYYRLDDEEDWVYVGVTKQSPVSVLPIEQSEDVVGRRIELRAEYTRGGSDTDTPIVRNVEVLAVEFPPNRKVLTANFEVSNNVQLRVGQDPRSASQIVKDLEDLVRKRKRVELTDPLGRKKTVLPLGPVLVRELLSQDMREPVLLVTAQYLEV